MKALKFSIGIILFIIGLYATYNWLSYVDEEPWSWQILPEGLIGLSLLNLGIVLIDKGAVSRKEIEKRKSRKKSV